MARRMTSVEEGLKSRAIERAVATGQIISSRDYGQITAAAKLDAEELINGWRDDTSLAEVIAQHVDKNSLAQAINYHALIHAGVVSAHRAEDDIDTDPDVCPICRSLLR